MAERSLRNLRKRDYRELAGLKTVAIAMSCTGCIVYTTSTE